MHLDIWLGVLLGIIVTGCGITIVAVAVRKLRAAGRLLDELGDLDKPQSADVLVSRWQGCDWCDPAGDSALTLADCTCKTACENPSGLWCQARARDAERELAAILDDLDRGNLA